MSFFRKKPIVIEAVQFLSTEWQGDMPLVSFDTDDSLPEWLKSGFFADELFNDPVTPDVLFVKTLEGVMKAEPGDWIIKGVKGELYPCKPDIFAATYDAAPEPGSNVVGVAI